MHPAPSNQPHKRKSCIRYDNPGHAHALTFTCFRSQLLWTEIEMCSATDYERDRAQETAWRRCAGTKGWTATDAYVTLRVPRGCSRNVLRLAMPPDGVLRRDGFVSPIGV